MDGGWACRRASEEIKQRLVISPRASMLGGALLKAGREWNEVVRNVVFKGVDDDIVQKVVNLAEQYR